MIYLLINHFAWVGPWFPLPVFQIPDKPQNYYITQENPGNKGSSKWEQFTNSLVQHSACCWSYIMPGFSIFPEDTSTRWKRGSKIEPPEPRPPLQVLTRSSYTAVIRSLPFAELTEHHIVASLSKIVPHFRTSWSKFFSYSLKAKYGNPCFDQE